VLSGLKERLLEPELIAEFAQEYQREFNRRRRDAARRRSVASAELNAIEARINRIVDAIEQGTDTTQMRNRLMALEQQRLALQRMVDEKGGDDPVIHIRPNLSELYRRKVAELRMALNGDAETRQQAIAILRSLIDKIVLHPGKRRGEITVELHGQLASITNLARPRGPGEEVMITMVAEDGLEPPTNGL
jgi:hypothetical protein